MSKKNGFPHLRLPFFFIAILIIVSAISAYGIFNTNQLTNPVLLVKSKQLQKKISDKDELSSTDSYVSSQADSTSKTLYSDSDILSGDYDNLYADIVRETNLKASESSGLDYLDAASDIQENHAGDRITLNSAENEIQQKQVMQQTGSARKSSSNTEKTDNSDVKTTNSQDPYYALETQQTLKERFDSSMDELLPSIDETTTASTEETSCTRESSDTDVEPSIQSISEVESTVDISYERIKSIVEKVQADSSAVVADDTTTSEVLESVVEDHVNNQEDKSDTSSSVCTEIGTISESRSDLE